MKGIFISMSLFAFICFTSCKQKEEAKEETGKLLVSTPIVMDTTIIQPYVCQIKSIRHIEIRSQERGYLEKIFVDEGQKVHKGELLFRIMPKLYNAERDKAAAEAQAARIEVQNTQSLSDKNIVAPNELAMAKAKLSQANAELALANTHLGFTEIRAPYDGIVDHLLMKLGSLVDDGDLLTTLSDNSQMWVYFNVPEAQYLDFKEAEKNRDSVMNVKLQMANQQIFDHPGIVKTIEADFDNETGNIAFRATFPNPEGLLRNGETGNVMVSQPVHNGVIIPQRATFEIMDKKYVYVVDAQNKVHLTLITTSAELPDLYVVGSGLKGDEKILLEGQRKVQDQDKIQYNFEDARKVISKLNLPTE
ncbi:efflux RND transporter periplasmic adaptor subunit [Rhizosphaericola mali]|uniref:Efflux RND transporter periplasmic adaptor subunit n=1 Tax=Rhizosphaericola mali TaxID=2545455 RepID=A0A5P2FWM3_9BACT|nr:efflux RND transporter periplasmic adaptor subunit [Rhizosphaericola mali]QES87924.1 efflux RND transporter periplasmic adaptor subunit [Rhizosphaericola mali]